MNQPTNADRLSPHLTDAQGLSARLPACLIPWPLSLDTGLASPGCPAVISLRRVSLISGGLCQDQVWVLSTPRLWILVPYSYLGDFLLSFFDSYAFS